jgi:hypothetical protein
MRAAAAALVVLAAQAALPSRALAQAAERSIEAPDGVPVTITSTDPTTEIYLAHGDVPARSLPDPFVRVGRVPAALKLAPGTYSIETTSVTASGSHERFYVESGAPIAVEVRPGNALVKTIGSGLVVFGVVAVLLGIVAVVSISPDDTHYNRFGIGLPLLLGGAGGAGLGVGLIAVGSTDVRAPHEPPGGAARPRPVSWAPSLLWRF